MKIQFEKPRAGIALIEPVNYKKDFINLSIIFGAGVFLNTGVKIGYIKDISVDRSTGKINSFLVEIDESEKEITIPYYFLIFNGKNRVFILNKDLDKLSGDVKIEANQYQEFFNPKIDHSY